MVSNLMFNAVGVSSCNKRLLWLYNIEKEMSRDFF